MVKTIGKLFSRILAALFAASAQAQTIRFTEVQTAPPPARMAANVAVVKDSSLPRRIEADIVKVTGPKAPLTYSGDLPGPYPGFNWFVSRHYAILSDMEDKDVRDALVLLELAWPHYVRAFQWRPPASETHRQAIVLASDRATLERCMVEDALHAPLLGGLTQEGYACSYLYAGAPYQTRYILLHEATHLYQYCLSGDTRGCYGFLLEGIADYLSSHIYDKETRALSVNVLDRAPIHNHLADGLADWERLGRPGFAALFDNPSPSRGLSVLMVAFLQRDADSAAKWRLFCERIVRDMAEKDAKRTTLAALTALYGKPESLDAPFKAWISKLRPTFELLDRDFDQSAPGVFTALPPSNATARLKVRLPNVSDCGRAAGASPPETVSSTRGIGKDVSTKRPLASEAGARAPVCRVDRPNGPHATAGFSFLGQTFAMSNTWASGCVFMATSGKETLSAEVPVAFMRGYRSPFSFTLSVTNRMGIATVCDAAGQIVAPPFKIGKATAAPLPRTADITLFASGAPVRFEVPALMADASSSTLADATPHALPEMAFPDFSHAISAWKVIGPFADGKAAESVLRGEVATCLADDGSRLVWRSVAAHPSTPIAPPILNLNEVFGRQANGCAACVGADIKVDADCVATLVLGVADGAEVFVNGERVSSRAGKREWSDGNLRVEGVRLKKGPNRLLLRLGHDDSAWLVSARIAD